MTLRALADVAGVSPGQASRVLAFLVEQGLVRRRDVPPAALFELDRANGAAQLVEELANLRDRIIADMSNRAAKFAPAPTTVALFGSLARGEADASSDIDLLIVRPVGVDEDDDDWWDAITEFADEIRALTGNPTHVLEVSERELDEKLTAPRGVWRDVVNEGIHVAGRPLRATSSNRA